MPQIWDRVQGIALFGICCLLKDSVIVKSEGLMYSILFSLFLRVRYVDRTPVKQTESYKVFHVLDVTWQKLRNPELRLLLQTKLNPVPLHVIQLHSSIQAVQCLPSSV